MSVTIRIRDNGPYVVDGDDVQVVDADGNAFPIERRPFALCRCGHAASKPFCDGSHNREGFAAADRTP
ncbi:MAG: CDGSH iron-sulfur domain-containing protein [Acidobacteria bacterium]|nr:CDGSH iron-sulfur domain-containing protein [Acidobacteriota bacterium]